MHLTQDITITLNDASLPDASAPTVTVTSADDVDSEGTLSVSAAVSGGEYDTIAYAWDDGSAGGSFSAQAASTVYTAPDVSADTDVTLTCTVTVEGDGTDATDGTSDTATGTKDITVNAAVAPLVDRVGDGDGAVVTTAGNEGEGEAVQSSDTVSVTVPLTGVSVFANFIRWSDNYSLGSTFDANGEEQILTTVDLNNASPSGQVYISITTTNNRFTPAFEASGVIIFEASDGETVEVMIADADISEPYSWVPSNSLEVVAFVLHVKDLTDQTGTLTLRGEGEAVVVVTGDGDGASVTVSGNEGEGQRGFNGCDCPNRRRRRRGCHGYGQ